MSALAVTVVLAHVSSFPADLALKDVRLAGRLSTG
jgi:hypothetical protein